MGHSISRLEADPGRCVCDLSSTLMADSKPLRIQGYATRFGIVGGPYRGKGIMFHRQAFDDVNIRDPEIKCFLAHDSTWVLGSISGGNLRFEIRPMGLWMTCDLIDSPIGRHVYESVKRRDMTNQSIAFRYASEDAKTIEDEEGNQILVIATVRELSETSILPWGAFSTTTVEIVDTGPARPAMPTPAPVPVRAPAPAPAPIQAPVPRAAANGDGKDLDFYRRRLARHEEEQGARDLPRYRKTVEEAERHLADQYRAKLFQYQLDTYRYPWLYQTNP